MVDFNNFVLYYFFYYILVSSFSVYLCMCVYKYTETLVIFLELKHVIHSNKFIDLGEILLYPLSSKVHYIRKHKHKIDLLCLINMLLT